MQRGYAPEWTLSGSYLIRGSDPNMIMACIDALKVDAWKSHLVSQDLSVIPGGAFDQTEKWYGTEYHVENVSPALLEVCLNFSKKHRCTFVTPYPHVLTHTVSFLK